MGFSVTSALRSVVNAVTGSSGSTATGQGTGTTGSSRATGFSGVSSFEGGGNSWNENIPHIRDGLKALKDVKGDYDGADRLYEIMSRNTLPTTEELKEAGELVEKLKGQMGEGEDFEKISGAVSMKQFLKGMMDWLREQGSKMRSFGTPDSPSSFF